MKTQLRSACLSLLAAICLTLAAVPAFAQNDLYDNGPVNGETSAWQINFGYAVSDTAHKGTNISKSNVLECRHRGLGRPARNADFHRLAVRHRRCSAANVASGTSAC